MKPRIDYLPNGIAILRTEMGVDDIDPEKAEAQGLTSAQNLRWLPAAFVLDEMRVCAWETWRESPDATMVVWQDQSRLLRIPHAEFGALYEEWLGKRSLLKRMEN